MTILSIILIVSTASVRRVDFLRPQASWSLPLHNEQSIARSQVSPDVDMAAVQKLQKCAVSQTGQHTASVIFLHGSGAFGFFFSVFKSWDIFPPWRSFSLVSLTSYYCASDDKHINWPVLHDINKLVNIVYPPETTTVIKDRLVKGVGDVALRAKLFFSIAPSSSLTKYGDIRGM